jgi:catechol 2,3-dioxygenase-like lactoylglutathione lyase family enzyme
MQLDHVALTVADRERSAAFYGEHFGLSDRVHDDAHLLILGQRGGGALLALSEGDVPSLPRTNHFGFRLGDGAAVRIARERLREAGIQEAEWQDAGGMVRVQVVDPDGYRVEFYAYA